MSVVSFASLSGLYQALGHVDRPGRILPIAVRTGLGRELGRDWGAAYQDLEPAARARFCDQAYQVWHVSHGSGQDRRGGDDVGLVCFGLVHELAYGYVAAQVV